jgi:hypothetical protein
VLVNRVDAQLREEVPDDLQRFHGVSPGLAVSLCENSKHRGLVKDCAGGQPGLLSMPNVIPKDIYGVFSDAQ